MSLALERILTPAQGQLAQADANETAQALNISVLYTSVEATLVALKEAGKLAQSLGARITLLAPQVVPYPLPLESPPVLLDWNERRFSVIARQSLVETTVRLYLCRDSTETLLSVLSPKSLVVIGGPKRQWLFNREKRLARRLRRAGHEVIYTETE
jgi:hypothetical protein